MKILLTFIICSLLIENRANAQDYHAGLIFEQSIENTKDTVLSDMGGKQYANQSGARLSLHEGVLSIDTGSQSSWKLNLSTLLFVRRKENMYVTAYRSIPDDTVNKKQGICLIELMRDEHNQEMEAIAVYYNGVFTVFTDLIEIHIKLLENGDKSGSTKDPK